MDDWSCSGPSQDPQFMVEVAVYRSNCYCHIWICLFATKRLTPLHGIKTEEKLCSSVLVISMDHVCGYMQKFKLSKITYWGVTEPKLLVNHKPREPCHEEKMVWL